VNGNELIDAWVVDPLGGGGGGGGIGCLRL